MRRIENVLNARARGLDTVVYEGGTHTALGASERSPDRDEKLNEVNRHPRMYQIYINTLANWKELGLDQSGRGAKVWCQYNDTGAFGQYGRWGVREYYNQPMAEAPKWFGLHDFLQNNPAWWNAP